MSIQMTLVFTSLCVQMAILFVMVLPLPHVLRRKFVKVIEVLEKSSNFKIGIGFYSIVMGLQFVDCFHRLQRYDYLSNPYYTTNVGSSKVFNHEQLASKFYSQRNLYISGAVLYLLLAIFTVSTILKKLVLKQDKLRSLNVKQEFGSPEEEINKYKELISQKDKEIADAKKKVEELSAGK